MQTLALLPAEEVQWRLGLVVFAVFMPPGSSGTSQDDAVLARLFEARWVKVRGLGRWSSRGVLIQEALAQGFPYGYAAWQEEAGSSLEVMWCTGMGRDALGRAQWKP